MKVVRHTTAGVDCGYRNTGLVVFDTAGKPLRCVHFAFPKTEVRYQWHEQQNFAVLQSLWWQQVVHDWHIKKVAVELPTGGAQSHKALRAMSLAFATVVTAMALLGVELLAVEPREVKEVVQGHTKAASIAWARADKRLSDLMFGIKQKDEHVADAAAAAFARGLYRHVGS